MLQDVTALVAGSWAWFLNRLATVAATGAGTGLQVVRVSFLLEVSGHRLVPADRFLFDVEGLEPDGESTEILKQVLTHANMLALPGTPYATGDLAGAQASLALLNYRLDFVVTSQPKASELIEDICTESRLLHYWEAGLLRVRFRPALGSLPAAITTFQKDDIVQGSVSRQRTVLREVVTQLEAKYRYTGEKRRMTRNYIAAGAPAAGVGDRPSIMDLKCIQDDTTAEEFADWYVERSAKPRYTVSFETYLPGLEIELGEIIGIVTDRFSYLKCEVTAIIIMETKVRFVCTVRDVI